MEIRLTACWTPPFHETNVSKFKDGEVEKCWGIGENMGLRTWNIVTIQDSAALRTHPKDGVLACATLLSRERMSRLSLECTLCKLLILWCREGGSNPHDLAVGGF